MVVEGGMAVDFCLPGLDPSGREMEVCLSELLRSNKFIVLYFYPKDNTSGCTREAMDFRDHMDKLAPIAVVVGVSPDSIESHKRFREKHNLNFYLLSDTSKRVMKEYGAFGPKKMYGKVVEGVIRSTFIISPEGRVLKVWKNVRVKGHVEKVLKELEALSKETS